jgi:predicted GIY-YIG superfamily endonuclease
MYVIYYISYQNELLYVGSTEHIAQRKRDHKSACFNKNDTRYNKKLYKYIRSQGIEWSSLQWSFEECLLETKKEAFEYETKKQIELNPLCNNILAKQSQKQRYEKNKEHIIEKNKEWAQNNREKVREIKKRYVENNPEKNRESKQKYKEKNREELNRRERERRAWKKISMEFLNNFEMLD